MLPFRRDVGTDDVTGDDGGPGGPGGPGSGGTGNDRPGAPRIGINSEPHAITGIIDALCTDAVPESFVRMGAFVQVAEVSGDVLAERNGLRRMICDTGPDDLRRLLARHVDVFRAKETKEGTVYLPASPTVAVCKAVLSETRWPGLRPLVGMVGSPVLRPDGTVLQEPGYDADTRLYYHPHNTVARVPDHPTEDDVSGARDLVLNQVLGDFPWVGDADRANFLALLMSPILRTYLGGLIPLGAISATSPGSGKTLLTDIPGKLFGMSSRAWVSDDDELRKSITATLINNSPVVVLDNVGDGEKVDAPSLAKLLTSELWDDRVLGRSVEARLVNDRLWLVTGNNIAFGGDIPQRTVLTRLDPRVERPDHRGGFRIPDLGAWLEYPENRAELLHALLILARGWITGGGERDEHRAMRGFGRWAQGMGGFLRFHGVTGFMDNGTELGEHDDEAVTWAAFLETWIRRYEDTPMTATDLHKSASSLLAMGSGTVDGPWNGTFVTRANGTLPTVKGLGMMLAARIGRFFDGLVLRGDYDKKRKVWHYRVERA